MLGRRTRQKGDTLIEVMVAFGVFSLVAIGALTVMNQGTALSQRTLELTTVRDEINGQAEALRFLHDSYVANYQPGSPPTTGPAAEWVKLQNVVRGAALPRTTSLDDIQATCPQNPPTGSFGIDSRNARVVRIADAKLVPATGVARLNYTYNAATQRFDLGTMEGVWIEAISSPTNHSDPSQTNLGYIDFHIFGCWNTLQQDRTVTLATIVRLYEPR